MSRRLGLALLGLVAGLIAVTGHPAGSDPAVAASGIRGVARVGPISPVVRPGQPDSRPLPGAVITVQPPRGGRELVRVRADGSGRFQLKLNPGSYLLVPLPPDPGAQLPMGKPQPVVVRPGRFTEVTVRYDSGLR